MMRRLIMIIIIVLLILIGAMTTGEADLRRNRISKESYPNSFLGCQNILETKEVPKINCETHRGGLLSIFNFYFIKKLEKILTPPLCLSPSRVEEESIEALEAKWKRIPINIRLIYLSNSRRWGTYHRGLKLHYPDEEKTYKYSTSQPSHPPDKTLACAAIKEHKLYNQPIYNIKESPKTGDSGRNNKERR